MPPIAISSSSLGLMVGHIPFCGLLLALHQHSGAEKPSACMQANVKTLSVHLGVNRVFWACIVLLELAYAGAIGLGVLSQVRHPSIYVARAAQETYTHDVSFYPALLFL